MVSKIINNLINSKDIRITFALTSIALIDISWGEWSAWSNCSAVCKENGTTENPKGTQTRSRNCNNASCVGDETETRKCTIYCRGNIVIFSLSKLMK